MLIKHRSRIRYNTRHSEKEILFRRIDIIISILIISWAILIVRNFDIAVIKHNRFVNTALRQQKVKLEIRTHRGDIYDRWGMPLSWNISMPSAFAVPRDITKPQGTAVVLANFCNVSSSVLLNRFNSYDQFCWVDRTISSATKKQIDDLELDGIYFTDEQRRKYRNNDEWRYLLGSVDIDGRGIGGAELAFDDILRGQHKKISVNRDAHGRTFDANDEFSSAPAGGNNVVLTIDTNLQDILSQKLKAGVERFEAKGAYGIFLEVGTSEVLAMAQFYPEGISATRNVVISDVYEPGSTFKLITVAAALNSGRFSAYDIIDCENGRYTVGKKCITDFASESRISFRRAVELSSNIAMIKVAFELGRELVYKTAIDFGFNRKTGIELPGESSGMIHDPQNWSEIEHATFSFGNGLAVTALQTANAYAAVGSGGVLYRPYILKEMLSPEGESLYKKKPVKIRRVISKRTASTLLEFFTGVVDSGTAVQVRIEGLKIAGKTGTARKAIIGGRGYHRDKYLTSFVGLYPAGEPVIVGYVVFDEPTLNKTAGSTAAPVFREILMEYICSSRQLFQMKKNNKDPRYELCSEQKENYTNETNLGDIGQISAGSLDKLNELVIGKPMRTAIHIIRSRGYEVDVEGNGIVRECYPGNEGNELLYFIKCG